MREMGMSISQINRNSKLITELECNYILKRTCLKISNIKEITAYVKKRKRKII